jgi:hypothetical protein
MPFRDRDAEGQDILRGDETLVDREDPRSDTSGDSGERTGSPIGGQTNTTTTQTTTTTKHKQLLPQLLPHQNQPKSLCYKPQYLLN